MKKILASLLVLALVAPALAVDFAVTDAGNGQVKIAYTAAAGEVLRGVALKVAVTGADIEAGTDVAGAAFNTKIDAAYTVELGGGDYVIGEGSGLALEVDPGVLVADGPVAVVSLGVLDQGGQQGGAPEGTGDVITIQLVNFAGASATVCVTADDIRGGAAVGDNLAATTITACDVTIAAPGPIDCYTGPDLAEWQAVGKPDSWCGLSQCHGDADNATEIIQKVAKSVGYNDIDILLDGFNTAYSGDPDVDGPDADALPDTWIAADFDHAAEIIQKQSRRVGYNDIDVLLAWFNTTGVPTDCQTATPVSP